MPETASAIHLNSIKTLIDESCYARKATTSYIEGISTTRVTELQRVLEATIEIDCSLRVCSRIFAPMDDEYSDELSNEPSDEQSEDDDHLAISFAR